MKIQFPIKAQTLRIITNLFLENEKMLAMASNEERMAIKLSVLLESVSEKAQKAASLGKCQLDVCYVPPMDLDENETLTGESRIIYDACIEAGFKTEVCKDKLENKTVTIYW